MPKFELDKESLKQLHERFTRGKLRLRPPYQRGRAWSDEMRYALVDTILNDYPMGVVLLDVSEEADADGVMVERWDTVDGQQRCTTAFEYLEGNEAWTRATPPAESSFVRFQDLTAARQERVLDYQVPIAKLQDYSDDKIREIFVRIQYGRALSIGEKLKALNSPHKPYLDELVGNPVFTSWGAPHQKRDVQWSLAAGFYQSAYNNKPLERLEYTYLERFLRDTSHFDAAKARKAADATKWAMNFCFRVLDEAVTADPGFKRQIGEQRLFRWLFAAVTLLRPAFAISGREPDVAQGLLTYWTAKRTPGTEEYETNFRTLRTGRLDTDDVKACLEQLVNYMIVSAKLVPLDTNRFFTPDQRDRILRNAGAICEGVVEGRPCGASLSHTNYHADHKVPHSAGGRTEVQNGQALCSACNRRKAAQSALSDIFRPA